MNAVETYLREFSWGWQLVSLMMFLDAEFAVCTRYRHEKHKQKSLSGLHFPPHVHEETNLPTGNNTLVCF